MPVASADVWKVLYTVSRYLFPVLAVSLVFLVLFFILSESRIRREKVHNLPGSGTVGELIVLSGSRDLDANTWFPVPREGVLGSVRSCDLVIPCPGVHTKHLDFSWEDGTGLLIRPRTGCEVQINGVPVTCRTHAAVRFPLSARFRRNARPSPDLPRPLCPILLSLSMLFRLCLMIRLPLFRNS